MASPPWTTACRKTPPITSFYDSSRMVCGRCGADALDGARFWPACGNEQLRRWRPGE